eukprot:TRINITY_DN9478_c0_g1_i2.p2 TRINITY_DN9478_c0_g1~~TRINITY_DN9478_c0_g1_i2.p2  ORF type:complete len:132 (-),score=37.42 TRINITY_DN9478_c0_g1_i2:175-570(-)
MSYGQMCEYFNVPATELTNAVFALFATAGTRAADVRKVILALGCLLLRPLKELLLFEFGVIDLEGVGYMSEEELAVVLQANHFASRPEEVYPKVKVILSHAEKFGLRDTLSEEIFVKLGSEYPSLFFLNPP